MTPGATPAATTTVQPQLGFWGTYGPWIGLGAQLLGTGISALGQYQGAKAMEREAARQAAEQEALAREWYERYHALLGRVSPLTAPAATQSTLIPLLRISKAAAPTLTPAQHAALVLPTAMGAAVPVVQQRDREIIGRMERSAEDTQRQQQELAALYPMRSAAAGFKGGGLRLAGDLLTASGSFLTAGSLAQRQRAYLDARHQQHLADWQRLFQSTQSREPDTF